MERVHFHTGVWEAGAEKLAGTRAHLPLVPAPGWKRCPSLPGVWNKQQTRPMTAGMPSEAKPVFLYAKKYTQSFNSTCDSTLR